MKDSILLVLSNIFIIKICMKNRLYIFFLLFLSLGADLVYAENAVLPMSSWLKEQYYLIEWCSPHAWKTYMDGSLSWGSNCTQWYFHDVWWTAKIVYDGKDFSWWNVWVNLDTSKITRTANTKDNIWWAVINFFTKNIINIQSEWTFNIKMFLVDYADNVSTFEFKYKIDKTSPQFFVNNTNWITEWTNYTYYDWPDWKLEIWNSVTKFDSLNISSSWDKYADFATVSYYQGDEPTIKTNHTRDRIHALYYSKSGDTFWLNTTQNDTIWWLVSSLVSWVDSNVVDLLSINWTELLTWVSINFLNTTYLNNASNTQKFYKVRLYDRTEWKWASWKPNYSEVIFYAIKDNTAPNRDSAWSISERTAILNLLSFPDNNTVFDTTLAPSNVINSTNGFSRYLKADDSLGLKYKLDDTWINCTPVEDCNAWLNTWAWLEINIENSDTPSTNNQNIVFSNRFDNYWTKNVNFSKVDNDLNSNSTYRHYWTSYTSEWIGNKICDLVWNCIEPTLSFRVVSTWLNNNNSTLSVGWDTKVFANWSDSYNFSYSLKDEFWNKIVPVTSVENWNTVIKNIETKVNFTNWLYTDQRSDNLTWNRLVKITDNQLAIDEKSWIFSTTTINSNPEYINAEEDSTKTPNGIYSFDVQSEVPSNELYPYLSANSTLKLDSINNKATWITGASIYNIWTFDDTISINGTDSFVNWNDWGLYEDPNSFYDLGINTSDYWKITFNNNSNVSFTSLNSRLLNFPFASPFVYWYNNYLALRNGLYMKHSKVLHSFDSSITDYNIYEKNLVCETDPLNPTCTDEQYTWAWWRLILNYNLREGTETYTWELINDWVYLNNVLTGLDFFWLWNASSIATKLWLLNSSVPTSVDSEIGMNTLDDYSYDNDTLKTWLVTWLVYKIWTDNVYLPSIWKWISWAWWSSLGQFDLSRNYYSNTYTLWWVTNNLITSITDIAVTWLLNNLDQLTTENENYKAAVKIDWWLERYWLLKTFQENVTLYSKWLMSKDYTWSSKKWCDGLTVTDLSATNSSLSDCTVTLAGWEVVSYIDWEVTLECSWSCEVPAWIKRTIIVKNSVLSIKSDITTLDSIWNDNGGQLLIANITDAPLWNVDVNNDDSVATVKDTLKWWILVDEGITNLDAYIIAKWPVISYSDSKDQFYSSQNTIEWDLTNQLYIYWSILSLNNVWWSKDDECPYIINGCDANIARIFDFIYMRKYFLVNESLYPGFTSSTEMVPYHRDWPDVSLRAWWLTGTNTTCSWELRCLDDVDYQWYPFVIERDTKWNLNPSIFFNN